MAADVLREGLPQPWTYGVTRDGRVFFINEDTQSTTWVHPNKHTPVQTGYDNNQDLPRGWERAISSEGIPYYIDHVNTRTTFQHPVTGESAAVPINEEPAQPGMSKQQSKSDTKRQSTRKKKQKIIHKGPEPERSAESTVDLSGWLYKTKGNSTKNWEKRWFVLSEYCLFMYKDSSEKSKLGSIVLPSYLISPAGQESGINKKFAFKLEHQNMKTHYLASDQEADMSRWMTALNMSANVQYANRNEQDRMYPGDARYPNDDTRYDATDGSNVRQQPDPRYNDQNPNDQRNNDQRYNQYGYNDPRRDADPRNNDPRHDQRQNNDPRYNPKPNNDPRNDQRQNNDPRYNQSDPRYDQRQNNVDPRYDQRQNSDPRYNQKQSDPRPNDPRYDPRNDPRNTNRADQQNPAMDQRGRNPGYGMDPRSQSQPGMDPRNPQYPGGNSRGNSLDRPRQDADDGGFGTVRGSQRQVRSSPMNDSDEGYKSRDDETLERALQSQRHQQPPNNQIRNDPRQQQQYRVSESKRPDDSMARLQEWTRAQAEKRRSQSSSKDGQIGQYPNSYQPPSNSRSYHEGQRYPESQRSRSQPEGQRPYQDRSYNDTQRYNQERSYRDSIRSDNRSSSSHRSQRSTSQHGSHEGSSPPQKYFEPLTIDTSPPYPKDGGHQQRGPSPGRPPLPVEMRQQYAEEIAQVKTPHTRQDLLIAAQTEQMRRTEPHYFQYPEVKNEGPTQDQEDDPRYKQQLQQAQQQQQRQSRQPDPRENDSRSSTAGSYTRLADTAYQPGQLPGYQTKDRSRPAEDDRRSNSSHSSSRRNYNNQRPVDDSRISRGYRDETMVKQPYDETMDRRDRSGSYGNQDPRNLEPRNQDPRNQDPRKQDPRNQEPRNKDPRQSSGFGNQDPRQTSGYGNQRVVRESKTAAQEFRDLKRRSGDYSSELKNKEKNRLSKHIKDSFKRLSLGTEEALQQMQDAETQETISPNVSKSPDNGGYLMMSNVKSKDFPYGYDTGKVPNRSHELEAMENPYVLPDRSPNSYVHPNRSQGADMNDPKSLQYTVTENESVSIFENTDDSLNLGHVGDGENRSPQVVHSQKRRSHAENEQEKRRSFGSRDPDWRERRRSFNVPDGQYVAEIEEAMRAYNVSQETVKAHRNETEKSPTGSENRNRDLNENFTIASHKPTLNFGEAYLPRYNEISKLNESGYTPIKMPESESSPLSMRDSGYTPFNIPRSPRSPKQSPSRQRSYDILDQIDNDNIKLSPIKSQPPTFQDKQTPMVPPKRWKTGAQNPPVDRFGGKQMTKDDMEVIKNVKMRIKSKLNPALRPRPKSLVEGTDYQIEHNLSSDSIKRLDKLVSENRLSSEVEKFQENPKYKQIKAKGQEISAPSNPAQSQSYPPKSPGMPRRGMDRFGDHQRHDVETIKEDPAMSDNDVMVTKRLNELQQAMTKQGFRMSITAADLQGKSHEELVLLLIQLRREQAKLEGEQSMVLERRNSVKRINKPQYDTLNKQNKTMETQLVATKPLVNLVDNMVTMGSLYGDDNAMYAAQYQQYKLPPNAYVEPKEMITFMRENQEVKLKREQRDEWQKLTDEEFELEEALDELRHSDRELHEKSFQVSSLQEDKELLEKTMVGLRQKEAEVRDPREQQRLGDQRYQVEAELTTVRKQLAQASKDLEDAQAANTKAEHEVVLMRKKVQGMSNKSATSPNPDGDVFYKRRQLEKELGRTKSMMEGLSKQADQIQQVMSHLRRSEPNVSNSTADSNNNSKSRYIETDLDRGTSQDIAIVNPQHTSPHEKEVLPYAEDRSWKSPAYNGLSDMEGRNRWADGADNEPEQQKAGPDRWANIRDENTESFSGVVRATPAVATYDVTKQTYEVTKSYPPNSNNQSYGSNKPTSEVYPQTRNVHQFSASNSAPQWQVENSIGAIENSIGAIDMNDMDDNTKRYYGLVPKEKQRSQTVRELKKREIVRKSRDKRNSMEEAEYERARAEERLQTRSYETSPNEGRHSAADRLFPPGQQPAPTSVNSQASVRRMSNIFTPKPFIAGASAPKGSYRKMSAAFSATQLNQPGPSSQQQVTVATVRPQMSQVSPMSLEQRSKSTPQLMSQSQTAKVKPLPSAKRSNRANNRARYMTISSSQPIRMETSPAKKSQVHSVAGDLISSHDQPEFGRDVIKSSSSARDLHFDDYTIDKEVLLIPEKVLIPERYVPESDEEETISPEEEEMRKEKSEQIKKMLARQSLQEWNDSGEIDNRLGGTHMNLEAEKRRREMVLDIRGALAREVTQKTKQVAEKMRQRSYDELRMTDDVRVTESESETDSVSSELQRLHADIPYKDRPSFYA